jgi:hypothetical protein
MQNPGQPAHGTQEKSKPRPFKNERVGHPEKLNQFLGVDVLEWYHPYVGCRQEEKMRKGGPPAERHPFLSQFEKIWTSAICDISM